MVSAFIVGWLVVVNRTSHELLEINGLCTIVIIQSGLSPLPIVLSIPERRFLIPYEPGVDDDIWAYVFFQA